MPWCWMVFLRGVFVVLVVLFLPSNLFSDLWIILVCLLGIGRWSIVCSFLIQVGINNKIQMKIIMER